MNKICTSLEQSKKLIELGIDVNSADMFYADLLVDDSHQYNIHPLESYGFKTFSETKLKKYKHLDFIPAWSLSALLELIPDIIGDYVLQIDKVDGEYFIWYDKIGEGWSNDMPHPSSENFIDAAFETICWLKENKMI